MADSSQSSLTFDMSRLEAWGTFVGAKGKTITRQHINLSLKNSAGIVQRREYKEAPRGVTGGLIKSIRQIVTEAAAAIGPANSKYAIFIVKGTKPHMPPIDAITPWAEAKGLNPWMVAMGIKKKGTKANPFVERTFRATKNEVRAEFKLATMRISTALARQGVEGIL